MLSGNGRLGPDIDEPRVRSGRPVAALLSDLAGETSTLVRQEIALFKAELNEKLTRMGVGAGALAAGGVIAFSGWLALRGGGDPWSQPCFGALALRPDHRGGRNSAGRWTGAVREEPSEGRRFGSAPDAELAS